MTSTGGHWLLTVLTSTFQSHFTSLQLSCCLLLLEIPLELIWWKCVCACVVAYSLWGLKKVFVSQHVPKSRSCRKCWEVLIPEVPGHQWVWGYWWVGGRGTWGLGMRKSMNPEIGTRWSKGGQESMNFQTRAASHGTRLEGPADVGEDWIPLVPVTRLWDLENFSAISLSFHFLLGHTCVPTDHHFNCLADVRYGTSAP